MRTTAEAQRSAPARRSGASKRGRTAANPEPAEPAPQRSSRPEPLSVSVAATRLLRVDEGLYALRVGELSGTSSEIAGMLVPIAHVAAPFAEDGNGVELVASFPRRGPWLGKEGGTVILRSPSAGGYVIVTLYGAPEGQGAELSLDLRRLDGIAANLEQAGPVVEATGGQLTPLSGARELPTEILLHIERAGDRVFPGRGWVGALGRRMRIEAYSIRPLEQLAPTDIEMKGFMPNGGETPWVPGGSLCGTRGRGLPLIGFAVRMSPQRADRFEVQYQGSFFIGGISETHRNGDPCRATTANDAMEAINVRVIERVAEPEEAEPEEAEPAG
jgi:hypothetical protein